MSTVDRRTALPGPTRAWFRTVGVILALSLLAGTIFTMQRNIDFRYPRRSAEKLIYLPSGKYLKPAVLGYDDLVADYLWLKAVGYFGGHYLSDQNYPWLHHMLDLITDLDPRFRIVYYFGGIVLALEADQVDLSNALLEKGMKHHPGYWKFPFFIGFNRFYFQGDLLGAAEYISQAASLPGSPEYLPKLAASMYARAGKTEDAIEFLEAMAATVDEDWLKRNFQNKIKDLRKGKIPEGMESILKERGLDGS